MSANRLVSFFLSCCFALESASPKKGTEILWDKFGVPHVFAKTVPDFVLKGRFADAVRLDLDAVEKEMGIEVSDQRGFWKRLLGRM